jgi:glyoxylase-like metal-dependent hydrolase (beta-lactamase superfamily II)
VRAVSLHRDVLVVTSAVLQVNCVIVRGVSGDDGLAEEGHRVGPQDETLVIDSPVLPDELDALPALVEQARYPQPSGLLATHGDWDHLLGRLAFPEVALGCAASTAERLQAVPGEPQRALRAFDEELMIDRPRPLALGSMQSLPVPGYCGIGELELELHPADVPWAGVLVVGDYLSSVEIPVLDAANTVDAYLATLERLRPLVERAQHVVPGHGPLSDGARALDVLDEDAAYLSELCRRGADAELPRTRRSRQQWAIHAQNVAAVSGGR